MTDSKVIVSHIGFVFQIGCCLMSLYWTLLFCIQYGENADANLITMKTFNIESEDKYPTFSFCFSGNEFHWYNGLNIFKSHGLSAMEFEKMLKGQTAIKYERNHTLKLYNKIPTFLKNDESFETFDQLHVNVTDFFADVLFSYKDSEHNEAYLERSNGISNSYVHLSYQSPDTICFSRKDDDPLNSIRVQDLITLKMSIIKQFKHTKLTIFLHYPGQLMRSFHWPAYSTSFDSLIKQNLHLESILEFKVLGTKTLRKRTDSNKPCKNDVLNDDRSLQNQLVHELGCIPIYWKKFFVMERHLKLCVNQEKLKNAYANISDMKNFLKRNIQPCNDMVLQTSDFINDEPVIRPEDGAISFQYINEMYEEIRYYKAMEFENWLSNVGGFVGIFLGYSVMQIPELIMFIMSLNFQLKCKSFKGKLAP